jgi:hypothetical protein
MTRHQLIESLAATILIVAVLVGALYAISEPEPPNTLPITGEAITTPVQVYQLDSGAFVHKWLDEEWGLACVAIRATASGPYAGITCIELPRTTYGLPAIEVAP